jgi:hypothetical protein
MLLLYVVVPRMPLLEIAKGSIKLYKGSLSDSGRDSGTPGTGRK